MPKNLYINNGKVGNVYWNGAKAKKVFFNNVLVYSGALEFSYTGAYTVDGSLDGNFVIRFQTSGTLTIADHGDTGGLYDLFAVGGGGAGNHYNDSHYSAGGGGGGYTKTVKNSSISAGVGIQITVGAGGAVVNSDNPVQGGTSSILSCNAPGGYGGRGGIDAIKGTDGGSGGGGSFYNISPEYGGGSNGSDGKGFFASGKGQGSTTAEFGEPGNLLYAGGGGGGAKTSGVSGSNGGEGGGGNGGTTGVYNKTSGAPGVANTGGGGGGSGATVYYTNQKAIGGSGIVCIRNHR